ncbi:glycosyltransferase family 4 protein [Brevundimonas goettingensis]|uniref:Glycosyltransferase family 4 protein n=1 Tax=Brevundimonas goettingensis TaxID=2774190 RepID=A0A975C2G8_9CAUL|nr:glycosyltransferase family 1 protein [Brevundimonas goettingensis]QTC90630.1 glycosyltransferase family 4 protein [Brevundimonas goettingensis]
MTDDILFDASRLVSRTERSAPTGVDRVCLAYAEWLLARPDIRMIPVRSKHDQLVAVDPVWFGDSVKQLRSRWSGSASLPAGEGEKRLLAALHDDGSVAQSVLSPPPAPDEVDRNAGRRVRVWKQFFRSRRISELPASRHYFNVGHTSLNTPDILASLKAHGVDTVVLLHDLIPITHPEFCRPGDGDKHRVRVLTALKHASRILVNSHYTAQELMRFADQEGLQAPPIDAIHLGLETGLVARPTAPTLRPYFVHVGTIEARKNLAFLLTIWRRLEEKMGDRAPRLVLVGRYGWENEAVLDHLERSPNLRGLVHQASNLPDTTLATLMSNAQAVVAPSSVEGFDLPAVEACALGVPLIASDIPAHRELVPQAELIDPLDGLGWLAALERATLKKPDAPAYRAPTWDDHFEQVVRTLGLNPLGIRT